MEERDSQERHKNKEEFTLKILDLKPENAGFSYVAKSVIHYGGENCKYR